MNCSICDSEMDLEGEGGIAGEFGILPVQFCVWCYTGVIDMFEQMRCEDCAGNEARKRDEDGETI